ncbi:sodium:solute symporter family transporter [Rubellicoccus peritrichatus]|uniref:Sodium/solute symporter n=1 Tax=Rubellicoccus peritrichatus TaxID=3080537 RepID=A0AAQ3L8H1_9BACT|nr:sodium/solute symporter [Puniceicoccus sp. CR14]WOO40617.1 sodium/solute symporter [Puniceicoccus sp. CR14]
MILLEITLFVVAVIGVIALGIWKSRDEDTSGDKGASDYFLAGRGLTWWLVGFSLIAANISTEQFVGMSGASANWLGMAIASYEWMAAITLVFVAFWFLPKFLKAGLYTIPEFLEYRFNGIARLSMAIPMIVTLVFVTTSSVIFSGAKFVSEYYHEVPVLNSLTAMCWLIALFAAFYVFIGGLKACAWTDLIWGAALIVGGAIVMYLAFNVLMDKPAEELILTKVANSDATIEQIEKARAWERFMLLNDGVDGEAIAQNGPNGSGGKVHMIRPKEDSDIPWTALIIGLWIPNLYYWGLNQYIVQRTLGSKSLAEGQRGIVFAAALKLIIPFIVVIPGMLAFNLFSGDLKKSMAETNQAMVERLGDDQVFDVDEQFVETHPDLAAQILRVNAVVAGVAPSPVVSVKQINSFAAQAIEGGAQSAGTLKSYDYDAAFPILVRNLIQPKPLISWFVLAALSGAVISSLASMLNSASTIATMDLYSKFTGQKDPATLVKVGRGFVLLFVIVAGLIAPSLNKFDSIFSYIQEFQGFISPGILAVFIFGFFSPRTPRYFGVLGMVASIAIYGALLVFATDIAFLNRMAITLGLVIVIGLVLTLLRPMQEPVQMPVNEEIELESSSGAKVAGIGVVVLTLVLYAIFW